MTEMPEKKVLKDLLTKLKSKTLTSADEFRKTEGKLAEPVRTYRDQLVEVSKLEAAKKVPDLLEVIHGLIRFMDFLDIQIKDYANIVHRNYDDSTIYIEALEKYSTELDNTLTSIFEHANKQAEEQIRQQEELSKRTGSTYTR